MATRSLAGLTALLQGLELEAIPDFPSADMLRQPIDIFHAYLADVLRQLVGCDPQQAYDAIQPANTTGNGDLDIVLPKLKLSGGPDLQDLAADLVKKFPSPHPLFAVPFKDGIHVRFFLSPKTLPNLLLPYILDRGPGYGLLRAPATVGGATGDNPSTPPPSPPDPKKVLVEFSSPNLGQDFRTDHLRSTILGAFVANAHEAMGWQVVRVNYLGDWGKHIGLLGLGWMRYGGEEGGGDAFRRVQEIYGRMEDEVRPRLAAKRRKAAAGEGEGGEEEEEDAIFAERDKAFKRLEDGDAQAVELWEKLRHVSVDYYAGEYRRMGVTFDDYSGESLVCRNPEAVAKVEKLLREKDISQLADDGSLVIDFGKHDAARWGHATLRGKDGLTTYFLRDVATVMDRLEDYSFDKLIYVVGEQDLHFRQVFKAVELLGRPDVTKRLQHLTFTRGPPQWGDEHILGDILNRCEEYVQTAVAAADADQVPRQLLSPADLRTMAVNSLVVHELNTRNKAHTIGLDVEMLMATEGETGLSLQFAYVKLCHLIEKLEPRSAGEWPTDFSSLWEAPWMELLRLLVRFPAVATTAYKSLEPGPVLSYLFQVVEELGYCLEDVEEEDAEGSRAAEEQGSTRAARLMLFKGTRQVLENGMRLLNITPVGGS
ncbi:arginyl-tRNA synthetase [Lasiosphaeria hispida]|uniref:arginine--tRNA ligase n=1 Tax=Lasiosphaeria hispida TaxID=260671 RepID=A0AAJ0M8Y1_9PEZI|nr:arginyl-tRNA synthetase [Lasiosphaeria hispida]